MTPNDNMDGSDPSDSEPEEIIMGSDEISRGSPTYNFAGTFDTQPSMVRYPLRPPTINSGSTVLISGLLAILITWLIEPAGGYLEAFLTLTISFLAIQTVIAAWRKWRVPESFREIILLEDTVFLPKSRNSKETLKARYEQFESLVVLTGRGKEFLFIDLGNKTLMYAEDDFEHDNGHRALRATLQQRIGRLDRHREVIENLEQKRQQSRRIAGNDVTATWTILGILAGFYALELTQGALTHTADMIRLGANVPALVDQGEYFRLIMANFLHANFLHIFLNGIGLFFLGSFLEKLFGPWRLVFVYLVSALGGSLASYMYPAGLLSVGSSTAIFGLLGAFGVMHLMFRLPPPFRQSTTWWAFILGINGFISVAVPIVDAAAHGGGFVAGGIGAYLVAGGLDRLGSSKQPSIWVRAGTVGICMVFAVGILQAGVYAFTDQTDKMDKTADLMVQELRSTDNGAVQLNQLAWKTAIDPNATRESLQFARKLSAASNEMEDTTHYKDTLATVLYRLSRAVDDSSKKLEHLQRAVELERTALVQALQQSQTPTDSDNSGTSNQLLTKVLGTVSGESLPQTYASQLARFLAAHRDLNSPEVGNTVRSAIARQMELEIESTASSPSGYELVSRNSAFPPNQTLYIRMVRDGKTAGLIRACSPENQSTLPLMGERLRTAASETVPKVELVIRETKLPCRAGARHWPMSQRVRGYP